jgi:hypothetical protein
MFNHGKIAKSLLAEPAAEAPNFCASRACARDRKFIFGVNGNFTPPPHGMP